MNNMKGKLLGYTETSEHTDAGTREWQDHDEGGTNYTFFIELNNAIYTFKADYSYGSCSSGYTSASWGYIESELKPWNDNVPLNLHLPKEDIFVNVIDNKVKTSIMDPDENHHYDATIEEIRVSDSDIFIVQSTGDGGCQYYSSGNIIINELLFK